MQQINKKMSPIALTAMLLFFFMTFTTIIAQSQPMISDVQIVNHVLDTDGKPLQVGVSYHIVPLPGGAGAGGVILGPNRYNPKTCPLSVAQSRREASIGLPIYLRPLPNAPGGRLVTTSTDYHFIFNVTRPCGGHNIWKVTFDAHARTNYIDTVGVLTTDLENRFKIELLGKVGIEREPVYKLTFCPTVCKTCQKFHCRDIGSQIYYKDGLRRLVLVSGSPVLDVQFKKA